MFWALPTAYPKAAGPGTYLDEALQGSACIADASLPVLTAGSSCHSFKLSWAVPIFSLLDTPTPPTWNEGGWSLEFIKACCWLVSC